MKIRIAICNLQTGIGTTRGYWQYTTTAWKYTFPHGNRQVKRAARFLREEAVDIVAFCEIEGGSRRTLGVDQVAMISERTRLRHNTFFPTFVVGSRINQGNAVCARFPVRHVKNHALKGAGEPRFLSEAEVDVKGVPVRVFVTHLALERQIREAQIGEIADLVRDDDIPTVLAGDFNVSEGAELKLLQEGHLQMAASAPTFPSWKPTRSLDYLFFSQHFSDPGGAVFDRFLFSDHVPLVVSIQLDAVAAPV